MKIKICNYIFFSYENNSMHKTRNGCKRSPILKLYHLDMVKNFLILRKLPKKVYFTEKSYIVVYLSYEFYLQAILNLIFRNKPKIECYLNATL